MRAPSPWSSHSRLAAGKSGWVGSAALSIPDGKGSGGLLAPLALLCLHLPQLAQRHPETSLEGYPQHPPGLPSSTALHVRASARA
eukprot:scaffold2250_cov399-Prasinococcus_capsulatus_cf.AAC.21